MFAAVKKLISGDPHAEFKWWLKEHNKSGMYTPDLWALYSHTDQLTFLYNEGQRGHRNHFKLVGSSGFLGTAYTIKFKYTMYKKSIGTESYPILLDTDNPKHQQGRVRGELFKLSTDQLIDLDEYMLNTVQFERVRTKVVIPHYRKYKTRTEKGLWPPIECWIYVGKADYWADLIDAGYQYPLVKSRYSDTNWQSLSNSFHYSLEEHNDFKANSKRTVSKV